MTDLPPPFISGISQQLFQVVAGKRLVDLAGPIQQYGRFLKIDETADLECEPQVGANRSP